ncbi:MAG: JAB domain-containing protein, partial [Pseudaminobacter sp.]
PTPSRADIEMTREIEEACRRLGIMVRDHLVVGRLGYVSLRRRGLL